MIRIVFTSERPASWAHELLGNRRILEVLRKHGVPCVGRLIFSAVERGTLQVVQDESTLKFLYAAPGEKNEGGVFTRTHSEPGIEVFMCGEHVAKNDDEDLF